MIDELGTLLESRSWVTRRIDRVEFLDLTTVRRTINLTVQTDRLKKALPKHCVRPRGHAPMLPLGWFLPWANAGAQLLNGEGHTIPYLTSRESDELVAARVTRRLKRLGIAGVDDRVEAVPLHRRDPAACGQTCHPCGEGAQGEAQIKLMVDRWGCRATRELLEAVYDKARESRGETPRREARELAIVLLAWQTNFVLFAPLEGLAPVGEHATLHLAFDEELRSWDTPLERGRDRNGKLPKRSLRERWMLSGRVSRGGPFSEELDDLFPRWWRRPLAWPLARLGRGRVVKLGRRGLLRVTWHVAWHQASGLDTAYHQVDVILPEELMAVRMRLLRKRKGTAVANVTDQVGSRATIVAPEVRCDEGLRPSPPPPPSLFSLSIAQRSTASWRGGAWLALLTGAAILLTALRWLPIRNDAAPDAITMLIVAPTLVAALLSVRAGSDLAEQLTASLRPLIGAVGVLAAACALSLLLHEVNHHRLPAHTLKAIWIVCSGLILLIAGALARGAWLIRRYIAVGRRASPRRVPQEDIDIDRGRALNPPKAPRITPPDLWLDADEGEIVPWGWLDRIDDPGQPPSPDRLFWDPDRRAELVPWVQEIFCYTP